MTERLPFHFSLSCLGEGNGNPLQCSCLENPRDGGAWWAAVYGVAQSRTRLKWLSSSSSSSKYFRTKGSSALPSPGPSPGTLRGWSQSWVVLGFWFPGQMPTLFKKMVFFFHFFSILILICLFYSASWYLELQHANSLLWRVGSSSLTQGQAQVPCIGSTEFSPWTTSEVPQHPLNTK